MFPSLRIGKPFGINLFVHWTFWLLPLWILLTHDANGLPLSVQLALVVALFVCVVLHELGHALTARHFGIDTRRIVLSPIGGVAQLERMTRRPWEEFCIAVAGPLVNVAISAGLVALMVAIALLRPAAQFTIGFQLLGGLLFLNVIMVLFNLLPAFPMDGGRVLRSILSAFLGHLPATRVAVVVGVIVAIVGGTIGAVWYGNPWLMVIAAFVIWSGYAELRALEDEARRHAYDAEMVPTVIPVRSTPAWPVLSSQVTVFVWDPRGERWVRETSSTR